MAEGLAAFLAEATVAEDLELTGEFATAALADETAVAVVTAGEDVLLAADEGDGWRIVGAKLASLGLEPWYGEPVRFVMVIGTDARPGYIERVFRADSIHLLTSNIGEASGAIVGFPRDSYVDTPYGRKDKLSSVNARADTEALVDIVRDLSGLPVEGYVITGFQSFRRMVDAFDGVVVDVPFAMNDPKSSAFLVAGEQTLWGQNALAFSRNRSIQGGDFTRSLHQGLVIAGALTGVQQRGILDLPDLLAPAVELHLDRPAHRGPAHPGRRGLRDRPRRRAELRPARFGGHHQRRQRGPPRRVRRADLPRPRRRDHHPGGVSPGRSAPARRGSLSPHRRRRPPPPASLPGASRWRTAPTPPGSRR